MLVENSIYPNKTHPKERHSLFVAIDSAVRYTLALVGQIHPIVAQAVEVR